MVSSMINVVICDNNKKFTNIFSKVITWFFRSEGLETNIIIVNNYNNDFEKTLELSNQIYILGLNDKSNGLENITNKINNKNKAIPILIMNDKCKKEFFNFLSGNTNLKNDKNTEFSKSKTIQFKDKNTYYSLNLDKILYVTTDTNNRQTIIKYEDHIYKVSKSLNDIIDMLDSRFIRTHRSCYINKNRLEYMDLTNNIIKFDNNTSIEYLSRRFKKNL